MVIIVIIKNIKDRTLDEKRCCNIVSFVIFRVKLPLYFVENTFCYVFGCLHLKIPKHDFLTFQQNYGGFTRNKSK